MKNRRFGFALNHMCCPELPVAEFFALARRLGVAGVELRNDIAGQAIADGTPAATVRRLSAEHGIAVRTINSLTRFNDWTAEREREARLLCGYARACGAEALVLIPASGAMPPADDHLSIALRELGPILLEHGIVGMVEPLGFPGCSIRFKAEAVEAISVVAPAGAFRIVHDTFHHAVSGETFMAPELTGIVHVSGVSDPRRPMEALSDDDRVLFAHDDRLDSLTQIGLLEAQGYEGPISLEPFAGQASSPQAAERAIGHALEQMEAGLNRGREDGPPPR